MTCELLHNVKDNNYTFHLSHDAAALILKLVSHVRLGGNNPYSTAAFDVISAMEDSAFDEKALREITFMVGVESPLHDSFAATIDGELCILEVTQTAHHD